VQFCARTHLSSQPDWSHAIAWHLARSRFERAVHDFSVGAPILYRGFGSARW
jgi:hypothetical protein